MKTRRKNRNRFTSHLRIASAGALFIAAAVALVAASSGSSSSYDISTLAGKVASVNSVQGLGIRFSGLIEQEAEEPNASRPGPFTPFTPITPTHVLTSPLDGMTVTPPAVTVNQDTAFAAQNETAIAIDPNNPNRIVGGANDNVTKTWSCFVNGTPCSAFGTGGYSGTYYSNNGGSTWCCNSNPNANYVPTTDPSQIGTLIPGVETMVGGQYDLGGDPSVAFDSQGHVFYAGLGDNLTSAPNTIAVNKGTFDGSGNLTWGPPTFINPTTSPAIFNDKPWIAVDSHPGSPFRDRIYVTWTRFLFNPSNGSYKQSPIFFVYSTDGGATFSTPKSISGNVLYDQGSRPVVGPDGTLYVFWDGATRLATLDSTYMVKSTDGGATWTAPGSVSTVADVIPVHNTEFKVRSWPAAAAAPNGDLYATWTTEVKNTSPIYTGDTDCTYFIVGTPTVQANCHAVAVYSKSTNGGGTWSDPVPVFDAGSVTADGYPVTQPAPDPDPNGCQAANGCDGSTFNAPSPTGPIEDAFPAVSVSANGNVYLGAYRGDYVSPWQTCFASAPPPADINCLYLGPYIHNTRLNYFVRDVTTSTTNTVSTHPINTRYQFFSTFIGDYTDIASDPTGTFHAFWTDTNNLQNVVWRGGLEFVPTPIHQQDVVTYSGNF